MRVVKILAWVVGCIVLLIIAAGIALWFGGGPAVAWVIEHPVSGMMGRQITIGGKFTIDWGDPTRIVAEDVHLANASWGTAPDMFTAKRLEIDVFVRSLIFKPTRIPLIAIDGGKLLLETSATGERNWNFSGKSTAPQKRGQFPELQHFVVRDSALVYRNGKTQAVSNLAIAKIDMTEPTPTQPVTIAADGAFQNQELHLAGSVGPLSELRNTAKPYPVKLDGRLAATRLVVDGTIAEPLDFAGLDLRLSITGRKFDELGNALGVPLPPLPDFRGTAELTGGQGKWALQAMTLALGKSDLEGGLAIDTNSKVPSVQANLTSSYIDLADFKGFYGGRPANSSAPVKPPDTNGRVLPDTQIAVKKLPGINADISFYATQIKSTGGVPFERVALGLRLQDGDLNIKPLRFHLAQGDVDLNLHFTPFTQNSPPKLGAEIDVRHVDLHELLKNSGTPLLSQTSGVVGGFIKIDSTGTSTRDFLGNMSGDAGFFMENGQLSLLLQKLAPIDVLEALGVYLGGDTPVPINCFVSRFDIKKGIATATTLLLDTPDTNITAKGNINFASETLYLQIVPRNKTFAPVSLRTPVDIQGTFRKPEFHLLTGALIERLGAAIGLGVVFPPAALLPLIDIGLGKDNACSAAYAAQQPPGNPTPSGSSTRPQR